MNSALRGWRRKKRKSFEEFERDFDKVNKKAFMVKVGGTSYGFPQLIHKGRKP